MIALADRRRVFAEEIEACCGLETPALVEALATVPREGFLPQGPWIVRGEGDLGGPPRHTRDADPKHVYHNVSIAIDPARQLFNGGPGVVAACIDALELHLGDRVLHIGAGLGYYSSVIAHTVGRSGRVLAIEVDEALAADATRNLSNLTWVDVRHGNGTDAIGETFDAILVNAGVTHPGRDWLDALAPGGRLVLPLTASAPQMGPLSKGMMMRMQKVADDSVEVRPLNLVAIYAAIGLRDESLNAAIGKALQRGPFVPIKRFRRDPHAETPACWLHLPDGCFTTEL